MCRTSWSRRSTEGVRLSLADGGELAADAAVLATGHAAPSALEGTRGQDRRGVVQDPWAPGALRRLRGAERVVIVGTGLTAVDVAVSLTAAEPRREHLRGVPPRGQAARPPRGPRARASCRRGGAGAVAAGDRRRDPG